MTSRNKPISDGAKHSLESGRPDATLIDPVGQPVVSGAVVLYLTYQNNMRPRFVYAEVLRVEHEAVIVQRLAETRVVSALLRVPENIVRLVALERIVVLPHLTPAQIRAKRIDAA